MAKRKMIGTLFFALIAEMDLVIKNMINIFFVSHYLGAEGAAAYEVIMPCVMVPKENTAPIQEISTEGFQVVSSSMFVHLPRKSGPTCTIWPNSINFQHLSVTSSVLIKLKGNGFSRC